MLQRVRLQRISDRNFEKNSRPQIFAFEIARERANIRAARRRASLPRSVEVLEHCAERRHAAAREIAADFGSKISRPQIFAFAIARERAKIRAARRRASLARSLEVPEHYAERRHAAAREIACDLRSISDRNFEKIKFSRPPQIFAFEIAREHANIRAARRRASLPRSLEVLEHCAERRHIAAREIACDLRQFRRCGHWHFKVRGGTSH